MVVLPWASSPIVRSRRWGAGPTTGSKTRTCRSEDASGQWAGSLRMKTLQKFASVHTSLSNHFSLERRLVDR
jgi:hypothetical protein